MVARLATAILCALITGFLAGCASGTPAQPESLTKTVTFTQTVIQTQTVTKTYTPPPASDPAGAYVHDLSETALAGLDVLDPYIEAATDFFRDKEYARAARMEDKAINETIKTLALINATEPPAEDAAHFRDLVVDLFNAKQQFMVSFRDCAAMWANGVYDRQTCDRVDSAEVSEANAEMQAELARWQHRFPKDASTTSAAPDSATA